MKIKGFQVSTSTFPLSSLSLQNPTWSGQHRFEDTMHRCALFKLGMTRIPTVVYSTWYGAIFTEDPETWVSHKRPGRAAYVSVCWQWKKILGKPFVLRLHISATSVPNRQTDQTAPSISQQSLCKTINPLFRLPFLFEMFWNATSECKPSV